MKDWYIDTSGAFKLLMNEVESEALGEVIATSGVGVVSSLLLVTELHRSAQRYDGLKQAEVTDLLTGISIRELPAVVFHQAGNLPGRNLRSLDALHLAAAISFGADAIITYDLRLARSAHDLGLPVIAPGPSVA